MTVFRRFLDGLLGGGDGDPIFPSKALSGLSSPAVFPDTLFNEPEILDSMVSQVGRLFPLLQPTRSCRKAMLNRTSEEEPL
jgi:hypothetical protein